MVRGNKLSQYQKLLQRMALTPKMKHSIQMLGMSVTDLNDYIDRVLASNPFLEKKQNQIRAYERASANQSSAFEYKDEIKGEDRVDPRLVVLSHVEMLGLDKKETQIAEYLIYEMDDNGYIKTDPARVASDLSTDIETVERVVLAIQSLDPPGIGAQDIKECLQIQLRRQGKEESLEYAVVSSFLSDVAINDISGISKALGADKKDVGLAIDNIKRLNPRPGSTLLAKGAEKVIPDLIVSLKQDRVRLEINRESLPHLRLYNPYENKVDVIKDESARQFLKDNMEIARNLIDNIKRREETMCRVAQYILDSQKEGLLAGSHDIKTLTLKDVADALKLHPSTISRSVSNKYIQLNNEVKPLKVFLSHGVRKENGELASKVSVKNRIMEFVNAENKAKPLSDQSIKEKLEGEGVSIERRTVTKYRNSLHILPAYMRKKKSD